MKEEMLSTYNIYQEIQIAGNRIMFNPSRTIKFENLYKKIVAGNTLRTFHRINKSDIGPSEIVLDFISNSKDQIIDGLKNAKSTVDIDQLSEELYFKLKTKLAVNVRNEFLENYNVVRKLIDLILEHIVLVSDELKHFRCKIISYLRVPLDSFILNSSCLFSYNERMKFELGSIGKGFSIVTKFDQYYSIQNHLITFAKNNQIGSPIYFDVLWRDRINNKFNILE